MKKIGYIIILIISLSIINSLVHSIYDLSQKKNLVTQTREELEKEKETQARLTNQLQEVKREGFVEKEARNKLFLVQPGETLVVIPSLSQSNEEGEQGKKQKEVPVWEQWREFFFGVTS